MTPKRYGFIGAGRMATALALGLLNREMVTADHLLASDPYPQARDQFQKATGGRVTPVNGEVCENCEVLFLAVKPQQLAGACQPLDGQLNREHLVISIVAGVSLQRLAELVGSQPRLVRVMPNTPCLVGEGAAGYSLGSNTTESDGEFVSELLHCVGKAVQVEEKLMDAVTALSGSGPAFVYTLIEALSDGGVLCGLPRDVALQLAAQTLRGAAAMVLQTGQHPAQLRDQVTSPGGTTIAGQAALEQAGFRHACISAVQAACNRSMELGRQ